MCSTIQQLLKNNRSTNFIYQQIKKISNLPESAFEIEERKIEVNGVFINYVRTGVGEHPVLLLPGVMGTVWTDFEPQINNLDKKNLTIIAWDAPGYGKSRPPNRTFPENFFRRDSFWAYNLMKNLKYKEFSLLGWSSGGITALILAAEYPENIRKLIVTGAHSYISPKEIEILNKLRNINAWSERMRKQFFTIYGEEYFKNTYNSWIDTMINIYDKKGGDICNSDLAKIKCQTLIIYGEKDLMVFGKHSNYLKANISNSNLKIFKDGAHNLHLKYADEFNTLIDKFLKE